MREVRPEIQALRALAVVLVLVYHAWPSSLPGGFVGVDVFFAISGFLITAHLLREVDRTGRVSLRGFWARRARRILPASLLVLLLTTIATLVVLPETYWDRFMAEARASVLYVENWQLAHAAVDYLAADDLGSAYQHFWSLSVEEQFYLVWPLLILGAVGLARGGRRAIAAVLVTVTAASLAYSVFVTAHNPQAAYFFTPARAWEFGAGGLLALVPVVRRPRALACWAGIAGIFVSALVYSSETPFPGSAALLPVLAALAVMWARTPAPVLRARPVQFLGDISYSLYLWHWPLLVLAPWVLDHKLTTPDKVAILGLTVLAAWATKVLVEDPLRFGTLRLRPQRATFGLAAGATAVVVSVTALGDARLEQRVQQAERSTDRALATASPCFGAAARDPRHRCDAAETNDTVVPSPLTAPHAPNGPCTRVDHRGEPTICAFGAPARDDRETIAVIGDSHAAHWRSALHVAARAAGWHGLSLTQSNCPLSAAVPDVGEPDTSDCLHWRVKVRAWLARHPEIATVFVSQSAATKVVGASERDQLAANAAGYARAWRALPHTVRHIVVIRDVPGALHEGRTLACVDRAIGHHRDAGRACALPRDEALRPDPAFIAARRWPTERVQAVDFSRYFCDARRCYEVVGGVLVHKDVGHMTPNFSATLGPYLREAVERVL